MSTEISFMLRLSTRAALNVIAVQNHDWLGGQIKLNFHLKPLEVAVRSILWVC